MPSNQSTDSPPSTLRALPRFDFRVQYAGGSDIGLVRSNNEDVWLIDASSALFITCDGMGGHADGEVAAQLASEAFAEAMRSRGARRALDAFLAAPTLASRAMVRQALRTAALAANARVFEESQRRADIMGCTLDAVLLLGEQAFVAHLGDSRVYLGRGPVTSQLTHDHSYYYAMLARGTLSPSTTQPVPDPLVNAVGLAPDAHVELLSVDLSRGDRLLLCTDGIHGAFRSSVELGKLLRTGTPDDAVHALIAAADEAGGRDNATAIVIEIAERFVTRPTGDDSWKTLDQASLRNSALFARLPPALVHRIASSAAEVEIGAGELLPRQFANALVTYLVLEGQVKFADGRAFGPPALLYPESLAGGTRDGALAVVDRPLRALRWRSDDFRDHCTADPAVALLLYERLARLLARG
ncbi:MAG: phosphoprotein phosphatase [Myxococcales bacterium]|nr:MAG: phosphoprotein phosphatase [Myxococcales bacterium]